MTDFTLKGLVGLGRLYDWPPAVESLIGPAALDPWYQEFIDRRSGVIRNAVFE